MNNGGQQQSQLGFPSFRVGMMITELVMGFFSQTVEVFLRHDFGERYFSFLGIFGSFVTYGILLFLGLTAAQTQGGFFLGAFFLISFVMCLVHHWQIYQRNQKGIAWHSRYAGTPWLLEALPQASPYVVKRWIEPVLVIGLGFFFSIIEAPLGAWLIFAGLSLAAREQIAASRIRERVLDAIDADIEARQMRAAIIEQKKPQQTEGFEFPVSQALKEGFRERLVRNLTQMYENIIVPNQTNTDGKQEQHPMPPNVPLSDATPFSVNTERERRERDLPKF